MSLSDAERTGPFLAPHSAVPAKEFSPFSPRSWKTQATALGILTLAIIAVVSAGKVFETRDAATALSNSLNTASIFRLGFLSVAGIIAVPRMVHFTVPASITFRSFLVYIVVCLASAIWSASPVITVGKALELIVGWLVVCHVASGKDGAWRIVSAMRLVLYYMALQVAVVTVLFLLRVPGFSEPGAGGLTQLLGARSVAPFISANSIGYFSATLLVVTAGLRFSRKMSGKQALGLGSFFFLCLLCSGSRTSLGIAAAGIAVQWLYCRHWTVRSFFLTLGVVAAGALSGPVIDFMQGDVSDNVFFSLSGRTWLWEKAAEAFWLNPSTGYGYGVGSKAAFTLLGTEGFNDDISSVHNGFLEVLLSVGILGFVPWLLAIASILVPFFRYKQTDSMSVFSLSAVIVIGITSIMSLGAGGAMTELLLLLLLVSAYAARSNMDRDAV